MRFDRIHVLNAAQKKTWMAGTRPAMTASVKPKIITL
jgi:hypothetical protein